MEQVDKKVTKLDTSDNSKKYKIEAIWNNAVYTMKWKSSRLSKLYYLIVWNGYVKEKNT